jgi:hypothetical protein
LTHALRLYDASRTYSVRTSENSTSTTFVNKGKKKDQSRYRAPRSPWFSAYRYAVTSGIAAARDVAFAAPYALANAHASVHLDAVGQGARMSDWGSAYFREHPF